MTRGPTPAGDFPSWGQTPGLTPFWFLTCIGLGRLAAGVVAKKFFAVGLEELGAITITAQ
jgi:hypothetical protein